MDKDIKELEKVIKYNFKNQSLIYRSLTHKSFDNKKNNEKLEFLGDRVLGLIISKKLLDIYPDEKKLPRPNSWSGWNLNPYEIEFWLNGENRIHERLKYLKKDNIKWERFLLSP